MASNRSPSPLSSRNFRNSETNSATQRSFNGNPFARPNTIINPKNSNPVAITDNMKRNPITPRKSMTGGSIFQDGKENSARSPGFMAPTISAASKFTPSPRKRILGEKNDVIRTSIHFVDKEAGLKAEVTSFDDQSNSDVVLETPNVDEVTLSSITAEKELLSDVTEDSGSLRIRPFCCSPVTSPIIDPLDSDPHLPPYDPKNNFLSPRPQFLRYKPNPRIKVLLNKDGSDESDSSSDTEEEEEYETEVKEEKEEKEAELGDSVHGSSDVVSEIVSEKQSETKVEKVSKYRFVTRSKTVSFIFLMFLVACFSVSFTDLPPMDLPIYEDVGFSELYQESLKFTVFAKESFNDLVDHVKEWSISFVSYLSDQKSHFFSTSEISSIQLFNLTFPPPQEEYVFNRHIGTDYIHEVLELDDDLEDEMEMMEEESYKEMEVDDDIEEVVTEELNETESNEQIQCDVDGFLETKLDLEDVLVSKPEAILEIQSEMEVNDAKTESASVDPIDIIETDIEIESNSVHSVEDVKAESTSVDPIDKIETGVDVEPSSVHSIEKSDTLGSLSSQSIHTMCLAGVFMVIMAAASAIFYMKKANSKAKKPVVVRVADEDMSNESYSAESSSVQKGYKRRSGYNKIESLASSSADLSMGSASYGSFSTFERIPIKNGDEVMLTPIRRSSRLNKSQATS